MLPERINYYSLQVRKFISRGIWISDILLITYIIYFLAQTKLTSSCEKIITVGLFILFCEYIQTTFTLFFPVCLNSNLNRFYEKIKIVFNIIFVFFYAMYVDECENNKADSAFINHVIMFFLIRFCLLLIIFLTSYCVIHALRTTVGASQEQIDAIPVQSFGTIDNNNFSQTSCSICLEDFSPEKQIKILSCHHIYCASCISEWLVIENTCPLCRQDANMV